MRRITSWGKNNNNPFLTHLSVPTDTITDPEHTMSDYYEALAGYYEPFFLMHPDGAVALDKFKENAFYSMEIVPGLRAIGLNSMWHYVFNL